MMKGRRDKPSVRPWRSPIVSVRTLLVGLAAALIFVAGLIVEPAALAQLVYICGSGGCGIRPVWLIAGFSLALGIWTVVALTRRLALRRAASRRGRTRSGRKSGNSAKTKTAPRRKASARG